jgi:hypothetical protein
MHTAIYFTFTSLKLSDVKAMPTGIDEYATPPPDLILTVRKNNLFF